MTIANTKVARSATRFEFPVIALVLMTTYGATAVAQDKHSHPTMPHKIQMTLEDQSNANTLLKTVRDATDRFKDVRVAEAAGYALQFGCVTGDDTGAMGLHYVNGALVSSGVLDATRPQIVIYEPMPDGSLQLIGADFLVIADAWDKSHSGPPELMGQLFHLFPSPNRFGLPAFYTLHVWAWKPNPNGAFVNWHPDVSCSSFAAKP